MNRRLLLLSPCLLMAQDPGPGAGYREWMQAGEAYRKGSEHDKALRAYTTAAGHALEKEQAARAWHRIGQVLEAKRDNEAALAAYKEAIHRHRYPETEAAVIRLLSQRTSSVMTAAQIARSLHPPTRSQMLVDPSVELFVNFEFNQDTLTEDGKRQVAEIAKACNDPSFSSERFELTGHTDLLGTPEYNLKLSERRVRRVRDVLVKEFKMDVNRFEVRGMGMSQPLRPDKTEEAGRLNRRVELTVVSGTRP